MRGEFGGSANDIAEIYEYLRNLRKPSIRVRARSILRGEDDPYYNDREAFEVAAGGSASGDLMGHVNDMDPYADGESGEGQPELIRAANRQGGSGWELLSVSPSGRYNFIAGNRIKVQLRGHQKAGFDGAGVYVDHYQLRSKDDRTGAPNMRRSDTEWRKRPPDLGGHVGGIGNYKPTRVFRAPNSKFGYRWTVNTVNMRNVSGNAGPVETWVWVPKGELRR